MFKYIEQIKIQIYKDLPVFFNLYIEHISKRNYYHILIKETNETAKNENRPTNMEKMSKQKI